jgi:hypothetical protein
MKDGFKASPWPLLRAQHSTYVDARTGRGRPLDYLVFYGLPAGVAGVSIWRHVHLSPAASAALLATLGLLAGLLFGVMLQISDRAMSWTDNPPERGEETTQHVTFLRELAANSGYASLVCLAAAAAFAVATTTAHLKLEIASAVGLALGTHLVLVLLMVMKRVYLLTLGRLDQVQTMGPKAGENVVPHQWRKASGERGRPGG